MTFVKKWVPVSFMGTLYDYGSEKYDSKEECEAAMNNAFGGMGAMMSDAVEVEVNMDPITDAGREMIENMKTDPRLKGLKHFHASVTPEFLKMNGDERMKFIYDLLVMDHTDSVPIDLNI